MEFLIADTFTDSLAKLNGQEQKAVKTTAFDLQLNPASPGLQFHKLDRAKDTSFWSIRVSRDIRIIVHRTTSSLLLCYVGHHDTAYRWAERRRIERHPKTGAAQLVELLGRAEEDITYKSIYRALPSDTGALIRQPTVPPLSSPLFDTISDDTLLGYGVPAEWLVEVRTAQELASVQAAVRTAFG